MNQLKIQATGLTHTGQVRSKNEDYFLLADLKRGKREELREPLPLENGVLLIVADGMGGAACGEVASEEAVKTIHEYVSSTSLEAPEKVLGQSIQEAQQKLREIVDEHPEKSGMGTVVTALLLTENGHHIVQVGDTRLYLLRDGELSQCTEDQSLVASLVKTGRITPEEARYHPYRNQVTQAIGASELIQPELLQLEFQKDDRLLLCSDGLNGMIEDGEIKDVLTQIQDRMEACEKLIQLANECGGTDNITVILADLS